MLLTGDIHWPLPPPDWAPAATETHVWAVPLDVAPAALAEFHDTLAPVERERAASFHFPLDRNRFVVGRGTLRQVLAHYLQIDPSQVEFSYGPYGKPLLMDNGRESDLHFNLAHSGGLALLAVTRAGKIGVDLERVRPLDDAQELVTRFFCPREIAAFQTLPEDQKPAAFFNLWTRKEAWLKATGEGIAHSLNRVEVSFLPGEPARLLHLPEIIGRDAFGRDAFHSVPNISPSVGTPSVGTLSTLPRRSQAEAGASLTSPKRSHSAAPWNLYDLAPAAGFAAALALPSADTRLQCWRWPETCK